MSLPMCNIAMMATFTCETLHGLVLYVHVYIRYTIRAGLDSAAAQLCRLSLRYQRVHFTLSAD